MKSFNEKIHGLYYYELLQKYHSLALEHIFSYFNRLEPNQMSPAECRQLTRVIELNTEWLLYYKTQEAWDFPRKIAINQADCLSLIRDELLKRREKLCAHRFFSEKQHSLAYPDQYPDRRLEQYQKPKN